MLIGFLKEFRDFAVRGNMVDMAVGISNVLEWMAYVQP